MSGLPAHKIYMKEVHKDEKAGMNIARLAGFLCLACFVAVVIFSRFSVIRPTAPGRNAGPDDHSQVRPAPGYSAGDAEKHRSPCAGGRLRHRCPAVQAADPAGRGLEYC